MFGHVFRKGLGIYLFILSLPLSFASARSSDSLYALKSNLDNQYSYEFLFVPVCKVIEGKMFDLPLFTEISSMKEYVMRR